MYQLQVEKSHLVVRGDHQLVPVMAMAVELGLTHRSVLLERAYEADLVLTESAERELELLQPVASWKVVEPGQVWCAHNGDSDVPFTIVEVNEAEERVYVDRGKQGRNRSIKLRRFRPAWYRILKLKED